MTELQNFGPKYSVPIIESDLRRSIQNNLKKVPERSILDIVEAYTKLPTDFSSGLLDDLNKIVVENLQNQKKDKFRSEFLIRYLEFQTKLPM